VGSFFSPLSFQGRDKKGEKTAHFLEKRQFNGWLEKLASLVKWIFVWVFTTILLSVNCERC